MFCGGPLGESDWARLELEVAKAIDRFATRLGARHETIEEDEQRVRDNEECLRSLQERIGLEKAEVIDDVRDALYAAWLLVDSQCPGVGSPNVTAAVFREIVAGWRTGSAR